MTEFVYVDGRRYPVNKLQVECLVETLNEICDTVNLSRDKAHEDADLLIKEVKRAKDATKQGQDGQNQPQLSVVEVDTEIAETQATLRLLEAERRAIYQAELSRFKQSHPEMEFKNTALLDWVAVEFTRPSKTNQRLVVWGVELTPSDNRWVGLVIRAKVQQGLVVWAVGGYFNHAPNPIWEEDKNLEKAYEKFLVKESELIAQAEKWIPTTGFEGINPMDEDVAIANRIAKRFREATGPDDVKPVPPRAEREP